MYTVPSAHISPKQELVILQSVVFSTQRTNFLLKIVENWEDRCVGLEPLTIVVEAQQTLQEQIASMLQRVQKLEAKVSQVISKPRVANLAAQILLLACGVEDFHETTTHHFSALGVQHPKVKAVSGFLGVQPRVFVTQANALVSRRNNIDIHFPSSEAFDKEVAEVARLIDADLRQESKWECNVVESYGTIKGSIPQ